MQTRVHINLPVHNVQRSIAFYQRLFGVPATTTRDDYANFRLDEPALHLALVQLEGAVGSPSQHFGVELFEHTDLADLRQRAVDAGLSVRDEEQISCCYAVGDKFWAADPDGHEWEFWVRTGTSDTLAPRLPGAEAKTSGSCCG
ncbi:MAG TPA: glyoxalase/bleomycin resistance/dioxygenase family protein [Deltaproteobacteria bacterium]|nr:glyoxalase/bleomycin resistance/dioxygenase family protein [Deltaproteobacteria bacterium]